MEVRSCVKRLSLITQKALTHQVWYVSSAPSIVLQCDGVIWQLVVASARLVIKLHQAALKQRASVWQVCVKLWQVAICRELS